MWAGRAELQYSSKIPTGGQVAYEYGSVMHLGKVKKIRNLGCSCPDSDLFFLSRDSNRG